MSIEERRMENIEERCAVLMNRQTKIQKKNYRENVKNGHKVV